MEVGGLRVASIVDRIEGPLSWTVERDVHLLYLYEAGSYHWLETWLDDQRTSLGDPLPGEMWLAPAGRRYHGEAKGGGVRYIEVEIPAARLVVAPDLGHKEEAASLAFLASLALPGLPLPRRKPAHRTAGEILTRGISVHTPDTL